MQLVIYTLLKSCFIISMKMFEILQKHIKLLKFVNIQLTKEINFNLCLIIFICKNLSAYAIYI